MITLTTEQAQQIEEALEQLGEFLNAATPSFVDESKSEALSTIRAARAQDQAEQEPVASVRWGRYKECEWTATERLHELLGRYREGQTPLQLYASPVRTKDLTDDELDVFFNMYWQGKDDADVDLIEVFRAVIQKYKEKNK